MKASKLIWATVTRDWVLISPIFRSQPTTEDHQKYIPPKPAIVEKAAAKEVETNDKEEDAPVVKKAGGHQTQCNQNSR